MRFDSVSDVRTVSSTNPVCFLKMGRIFSWMVLATSWVFPDLLVISTTRVNILRSFRWLRVKGTRRERNGGNDLSVFESYGTPPLAEGQLPKFGAEIPRPLNRSREGWHCYPSGRSGDTCARCGRDNTGGWR